MHGNFVGLGVVFISAVLLPCKRLPVLVVEVSGQSRISFKSIIMEYTPWEIYALQLGNTELQAGKLVWKAALRPFIYDECESFSNCCQAQQEYYFSKFQVFFNPFRFIMKFPSLRNLQILQGGQR